MLSEVHQAWLNSYVDPFNMQTTSSTSTASTSTAQASSSMSQHEFLFNTLTAHVEELDTLRFMQQEGRRRFPHASIPYNYSSRGPTPMVSAPNDARGQPCEEESEGEEEISYSQPWSAPIEQILPRATSQTVPPLSVNSHQLPKEATNHARQFMAQHNPSPRSSQIPLIHGPSFLNSHQAH